MVNSHQSANARRGTSLKYYVYAAATFPYNGDASPIDHNNFVFPPKNTRDNHHLQSACNRQISPLSPLSPLRSRFKQEREASEGYYSAAINLDKDPESCLDDGNNEQESGVGKSLKRSSSLSSLTEYREVKHASLHDLRPALAGISQRTQQPTQDDELKLKPEKVRPKIKRVAKPESNSVQDAVILDRKKPLSSRLGDIKISYRPPAFETAPIRLPVNKKPPLPRQPPRIRTKLMPPPTSKLPCPIPASSVPVPTRPPPPARHFSFQESVPARQHASFSVNDKTIAQQSIDAHIQPKKKTVCTPAKVQGIPKKSLGPRTRPSVIGAFSSTMDVPARPALTAPISIRPRSTAGKSGCHGNTDRLNRQASSASPTSTAPSCVKSTTCRTSVASQRRISTYVWTPTPEPRELSIVEDATYSTSTPCFPVIAPVQSDLAPTSSLGPPQTEKHSRRFSLQWLSKNSKRTVTSPVQRQLKDPSASLSLIMGDPIQGGQRKYSYSSEKVHRCLFHKALPAPPTSASTRRGSTSSQITESVLQHHGPYENHKNNSNNNNKSKPKLHRLSILSTASSFHLKSLQDHDKTNSTSTSWASKLKFRKSIGAFTTTGSTSDAVTANAESRRHHQRQNSSLLGALRERQSGTSTFEGLRASVISAPLSVVESQKQPRCLLPSLVQRALIRRSRSQSLQIEPRKSPIAQKSHQGTSSSSIIEGSTATAMPYSLEGLTNYNPTMSASLPCLSSSTPVTPSPSLASQRRDYKSTPVVSSSSSNCLCAVARATAPIPIPLPVLARDQRTCASGQQEQLGTRARASKLPQQQHVAKSCDKDKMTFFEPFRIKNRNESYISFHFDISHLEDDQPQEQEQQQQQEQQQEQSVLLDDIVPTIGTEDPKNSQISLGTSNTLASSSSSTTSSRTLFHIFRRPTFLNSMPSLSLSSRLLPEFSSSVLSLGGRKGSMASTALGVVAKASTNSTLSEAINIKEQHGSEQNRSRRNLHHFCHEGLQQAEQPYSDSKDVDQHEQTVIATSTTTISTTVASTTTTTTTTTLEYQTSNDNDFQPRNEQAFLLPPLRQFSRPRKGSNSSGSSSYTGGATSSPHNRFSISSVSLPTRWVPPLSHLLHQSIPVSHGQTVCEEEQQEARRQEKREQQ